MMVSVVAARYARALADSVLAAGSDMRPVEVSAQLQGVESLLASSPELRHVMLSPAVAAAKKRAVIGSLAEQLGLQPKVRNFIYVLIDHRRIPELSAIREAFEMTVDEQMGFVRADITSAQPLSDAQRGVLESQLNRLTGKRVRMQFGTDTALIGGLIARIGSTVYDGSVRGQLETLRRRLTTES
jgi:F-type H+-transporting ATPase subunit delta